MSGSLINIDGRLNRKETAAQLALQCAPLLTNIKISNILIVGIEEEEKVRQLFKKSLLDYHILFKCKRRVVFLLYSEKELLKFINETPQEEFLYALGYEKIELAYILEKLCVRYQHFMKEKEQFPHELGTLLGYPTDDVKSFIIHEGKNFLYTGYWKVYHNLPEALETFMSFNEAKRQVIELVTKGFTIEQIIDCYHVNKEKVNQIAV